MPKLSIIIPVFNTEKYLRKCLDSIINQSLKDIEIICVDDGSTDNSSLILNEYAQKDKRIILISQLNQGQGIARNNAINIATGQYVGFVDSDDWVNSEMFEKLYNTAVKFEADIVHCDYYKVLGGELCPCTTINYLKKHSIHIAPYKPYNFKDKEKHIFFGISNLPCMRICKLDMVKQYNIKFAEIKYNEDNPFCLEMLVIAKKIVYINEPLYYYRYLSTSCSRMIDKPLKEMYNTLNEIRKKYYSNNITISFAFDRYWINVLFDEYLYYIPKTQKFKKLLDCQKNLTLMQNIFLCLKLLKKIIKKFCKKIKTENYIIYSFLGLKFKVRINSDNELKLVTENYNKVLANIKEKINQNRKIKVLFLVRENSKWGYDKLYHLLENSNLFEPFIVVSILTNVAKEIDKTRNNLNENYNFFKNLGYNVKYGFNSDENLYINLKEFNPDIVFYEQMWHLPNIHKPLEVSKFALTYYSSYSYEICDDKENYTSEFHRLLFKYFLEHNLNLQRYEKICKGNSKNCIVTGYPKLDAYNNTNKIDTSNIWKEPNKIKIIYAPHHSFEKDELNFATFKENGKFILELAKKYDETTWLFKPHPRFKFALLINNVMTEDDINKYYNEWLKIGRIYDKGNYFDIFKTSDLLITDSISFRAEYLPTLKPIICPTKHGSCKMNLLGKKIIEGAYITHNNKELKQTIENLINNNDTLYNKRKQIVEEIFGMTFNSSENIISIIEKDIK